MLTDLPKANQEYTGTAMWVEMLFSERNAFSQVAKLLLLL